MRKFFVHIYQKRLNSQSGVAALMSVIIAMVTLASIALNYIAETQQEQAGSALTYTSTNAGLIAEAGLRYAEKCLKQNVSGCPCYNATCSSSSSCCSSNWPNLQNAVYSAIALGDTRGSFTFIVTSATTAVARVKSTGAFAGASREMYKNVFTTCALSQNAITTCGSITISGDAAISPSGASTQTGQCSEPAIPTLTFPTGYTGCPNASYPNFTSGSVASPYQYCKWDQSSGTVAIDTTTMTLRTNTSLGTSQATFTNGSATVTLSSGSWPSGLTGELISADGTTWYSVSTVDSPTQITLASNFAGTTTTSDYSLTSPVTIWVYGDFKMSSSAIINTKGNVTINVGGKVELKDSAAINITSGSLTMHSEGDFKMKDSATMNYPAGGSAGNAAKLLVLVEGKATLEDDSQFSGAMYVPDGDFEIKDSVKFVGSVVAKKAKLKDDALLTFDSTAGSSASTYSNFCGSSSTTDQYGGG